MEIPQYYVINPLYAYEYNIYKVPNTYNRGIQKILAAMEIINKCNKMLKECRFVRKSNFNR